MSSTLSQQFGHVLPLPQVLDFCLFLPGALCTGVGATPPFPGLSHPAPQPVSPAELLSHPGTILLHHPGQRRPLPLPLIQSVHTSRGSDLCLLLQRSPGPAALSSPGPASALWPAVTVPAYPRCTHSLFILRPSSSLPLCLLLYSIILI